MISKIKNILLKVKKDNKSLHQIDLSEKFVKENFKFNICENHLTDAGLERIVSFGKRIYQKELDLKANKDDLWNEITSREDHENLKKYCLNKDKIKFKDLILEAGKTNLTYGFSNYKSYKDLSLSSKNRNKEAVQLLDKAISLAEYLRLIKVYNPEQGDWHTNDINYRQLFNLIFNFKDKNIKPFKSPNYIYGVNFDKSFYCLKDLKNIYTSIRIDEIIKNNTNIKTVNEIGAGLGYAAYYNTFFNNLQYNIYDLPAILVLQAYYLMLSLGENKVLLDGEKKNDTSQINLFPYWKIFQNLKKVICFQLIKSLKPTIRKVQFNIPFMK